MGSKSVYVAFYKIYSRLAIFELEWLDYKIFFMIFFPKGKSDKKRKIAGNPISIELDEKAIIGRSADGVRVYK